ncbi:hypothetical protein BGY98DRAFT_1006290 [Russula aff. rugulosa BPL654]|nr:hypothetical protein BGY98DRAFT_1006290 [Russula aff. rugulosa BPL654]
MHQYKTIAQMLLLLSIFNLVLGAPVVREIYEARDDRAVPVVARNVAVMSKQRSQVDSDMPTPSHSSPPPQDGSTTSNFPPPVSDESTPSHPPLPLPDGSKPLYASSPSDGEASLHGSPTPPGGPAVLTVSSPPDEIVPATDRPPVRTSALPGIRANMAAAAMRTHTPLQEDHALMVDTLLSLSKKVAIGASALAVAGAVIFAVRRLRHNHHHRTIDPDSDCSTVKGSRPPCHDY